MRLWGREWTRRELTARVGRLEQIGGLRRFTWREGLEDAVEAVELSTGAGLRLIVLPSRGLDIGETKLGDAPLTWMGPAGDVHPAFYDPEGLGFLKTFAGGLLTTCGHQWVGGPDVDDGQPFGLHGRAHHLPARHIAVEGRWVADDYEMRIAGTVEEGRAMGALLQRRREIRARLGDNRIFIEDTVENVGFTPAPHMTLYHCNFGFPLLTEDARVAIPSTRAQPAAPDMPADFVSAWQAPDPAFSEKVWWHEGFAAGADGYCEASIAQPAFPLPGGAKAVTARLAWDPSTLPYMAQWWMPGAGAHVLGLEPANCFTAGRVKERAAGRLRTLEPGEAVTHRLVFSVTM